MRVEGSVNRLATVTPARLFFCDRRLADRLDEFLRARRAGLRSVPSAGPRASAGVAGSRRRVSVQSCSCQLSFEPAFQYHRGGRRVDIAARDAPPAFAACARAAQPLLGVLRGPAFIDQVDGKREARCVSSAAKRRAASVSGLARAVGIIGLAHRNSRGAQYRRARARARAQSGPSGPLAMVARGWAVRVSVSPLAMPMRLSPKSSATTIFGSAVRPQA